MNHLTAFTLNLIGGNHNGLSTHEVILIWEIYYGWVTTNVRKMEIFTMIMNLKFGTQFKFRLMLRFDRVVYFD